jgi:hypothetical protein
MSTATPGTPATITIHAPSAPPTGQRHPNLFNRLADVLRSRHYSRRAGQTCLREDGHDIRTIQEHLRRTDVSTPMSYTPMLTKGDRGVRGPVDAPRAGIGSLYIPRPQMSAPNW